MNAAMRRSLKLPLKPSAAMLSWRRQTLPRQPPEDLTWLAILLSSSEMKPRKFRRDDSMWKDIEVIACLGERGDIIDVTKQIRMIDGRSQQRWLSSRNNEILIERSDGHFDTKNGGEIIARIPD
jgi:hypothetical protein